MKSTQQATQRDVQRIISDLENSNRDGSIKGEASFFEDIAADDYLAIDPLGQLSNKSQALSRRRAAEMKYDSIAVREEQVRVYGNTAIVTGCHDVRGRHNERDASGQYRFTRVYVRTGERWRIVSSHSTRVGSAAPR